MGAESRQDLGSLPLCYAKDSLALLHRAWLENIVITQSQTKKSQNFMCSYMSAEFLSSFQAKSKTNNQFKNSIFGDMLFTVENVDFY